MGDFHLFYYIIGLVLLKFLYDWYRQWNPHEKDEAELIETIRKNEVTRLVTEREYRQDQTCMAEEKFWELIELAKSKGNPTYQARLSLFRDFLSSQCSPEELVHVDNRFIALIREYFSQDVLAASTILSGEKSIAEAFILMNVFMMEGEVFFKNACVNPNIMIGKNFDGVVEFSISDRIADLYFRKTNRLIPELKEVLKIEDAVGEPWDVRELPKLYPQLWNEYA